MYRKLTVLSALLLSLPAFSATPVNLGHQSASQFVKSGFSDPTVKMEEVSRSVDFNRTSHIRVKQTYQGRAVWGGEAVLHTPNAGATTKPFANVVNAKTTMNGVMYQQLSKDLANTPAYIFNAAQQEKVLSQAIKLYQEKAGKKVDATDKQAELIVYIDDNNQAHWAFLVSFLTADEAGKIPAKPTFIMDAVSLTVYQQWNNVKTLDKADGGGFGGNHKVGKKIFDGISAPKLQIMRDAKAKTCFLKNDLVTIKDDRNNRKLMSYACEKQDETHNNVYWHDNDDMIATTWSPSNDALFGAKITYDMFMDWYKMPMLVKDGKPMMLPVVVHAPDTNAYWTGSYALFGDSQDDDYFNPFTQLDTVGHEIAHGFTEQHSDLQYYGQSGGLNEAFSDMAGVSAEFYAYGHTDYLVGLGDVQAEGKALRYMDKPSRDCEDNQRPGSGCSIDDMSQYSSGMDVHYTSGIFNRVFYTLANTEGWDARKAFDVMVQANVNYWTSTTSYTNAACGVIKAAGDYGYPVKQVIDAFKVVKIDVSSCFESKPH
ncbi:MAG: M4 family metallopeptidase [Gammaproteobacteria bacterium]